MKLNTDPFEVRIPYNFDAYSIIPQDLKTKKKQKLRDAMHYLLDLLFPKPLEKRKQRDLEQAGFISLNADTLKSIIGDEYKYVIDLLDQNEIIFRDMQYIPGEKNRGYRITQEYYREIIKVEITNPGICQRFWTNKKKQNGKRIAGLRKINYLTKWLDKTYVKIDVNAAHFFIETYRILMLKLLDETEFSSDEKRTEARFRVINRVSHQKHVVKLITEGKFNPGRDPSGRLYSPIVNLKKELRGCVSINGEKICSIDVKSSQPYLFQTLLKKRFWMTAPKDKVTLYNIYKERYDQLNHSGIRERIIMILNSLETQYGSGLQEMPFKKFRWHEDFYEYVMFLIQGSGADANVLKYFHERGKVKSTVMLLLYDLYHHKSPPYYVEFKKHFPDEVRLMDIIKEYPIKRDLSYNPSIRGSKINFGKVLQKNKSKLPRSSHTFSA